MWTPRGEIGGGGGGMNWEIGIDMYTLICGILSMTQMNLSTKQKQTHRHREQTVVAKGEEGWEREVLGVWD